MIPAGWRGGTLRDHAILILLFLVPFVVYGKQLLKNIAMVSGDGLDYLILRSFSAKAMLEGSFPFWNSTISAGVPHFANSQTAVLYPFSWLALVMEPTLFSNVFFLLHAGMGGVFCCMYLRRKLPGAMVPAVGGFLFSLSTIIGGYRKEHVNIYATIIWLPLILWFIEGYLAAGRKRLLVFAAAVMAVQFFAGFPQVAIYSDMVVAAYLIFHLSWRRGDLTRSLAALGLMTTTYCGFIAVQLLPTLELMGESSRGHVSYEFFSVFSTDWRVIGCMLFPGIFGPNLYNSMGIYESTGLDVEFYMGVIPLIYLSYALRYHLRDRFVMICAAIAGAAFIYMICAHIPLLGHFIHRLPVLGSFRCPSRIIFAFVFFSLCLSCFTLGKILSVAEGRAEARRLFRHSTDFLVIVAVATLCFLIAAKSQLMTPDGMSYYRPRSGLYSWPISLAVINWMVIGLIHLNHLRIERLATKGQSGPLYLWSTSVMLPLAICVVSLFDVGRFSFKHYTSDVDAILASPTMHALAALPEAKDFRILPMFASPAADEYRESGLGNGANCLHGVKSLKGFLTFDNRPLDIMFGQTSYWHHSVSDRSIAVHKDLLSMLSVRYVLSPAQREWDPPVDLSILRSERGMFERLIEIPEIAIDHSKGLFVLKREIEIRKNQWIKVDFQMDAKEGDVRSFSIDLHGGDGYDDAQQDASITIKAGAAYSLLLPTGDPAKASEKIGIRVTCDPLRSIIIKNLTVSVASGTPSADTAFRKIADLPLYDVYENIDARPMLSIPESVKGVVDWQDLPRNRDRYPRLDRVSYVQGHADMICAGSVRVVSETCNGVKARVTSESGTFLNYSQSHYPGWRVYVDGERVLNHRVNGLIQGVRVPPGEHLVEFSFLPGSFVAGLSITAATIVLLSVIWLVCLRRSRRKTHAAVATHEVA